MSELRLKLVSLVVCGKIYRTPLVLVVAVKLPSGAIEVITNTQNIEEKLKYYYEAYDDDFRLKTNTVIKVVGFMVVLEE